MDELPQEMHLEIAKYLDYDDLANLYETSKIFYKVITEKQYKYYKLHNIFSDIINNFDKLNIQTKCKIIEKTCEIPMSPSKELKIYLVKNKCCCWGDRFSLFAISKYSDNIFNNSRFYVIDSTVDELVDLII